MSSIIIAFIAAQAVLFAIPMAALPVLPFSTKIKEPPLMAKFIMIVTQRVPAIFLIQSTIRVINVH
jgi:hypothetical protein